MAFLQFNLTNVMEHCLYSDMNVSGADKGGFLLSPQGVLVSEQQWGWRPR